VNGLIATDINISKLVKRIKQKKQKNAEKKLEGPNKWKIVSLHFMAKDIIRI